MTPLLPHDGAEAVPIPATTVRVAPKVRCPTESVSALAERFEREAMPYRAALLRRPGDLHIETLMPRIWFRTR